MKFQAEFPTVILAVWHCLFGWVDVAVCVVWCGFETLRMIERKRVTEAVNSCSSAA